METNKLTTEELELEFCEVRKAHRLIYEYQRRVQDLTWYIKNKLCFDSYEGYKKFSAPIKDGKKIHVENWSWDWIYTYAFEYYLGYNSQRNVRGSAILISDNGFWIGGKEAKRTELDTFASPENSKTLLVFYLVIGHEGEFDDYWKIDEVPKIEGSITHNKTKTCSEIVYPVDLHRFLNEESTLKVLQELIDYCESKTGIRIALL